MKRSKIFLGVTASVLAVVAFAAAKTARFTAFRAGYYTNPIGAHHCTLSGNISGYVTKVGSADRLKASGGQLLYSFHNGSCVTPLYTSSVAD